MDAGTSAHCKQDRRSFLDQGLGQSIGEQKNDLSLLFYTHLRLFCVFVRYEKTIIF